MSRLLFFTGLFFAFTVHGQETKTIRFSKEKNQLYFFQSGLKRDTIQRGKGDLFYLIIPDTLKENLRISIENAKMEVLPGDSLVRLVFIPGLRYEVVYSDTVNTNEQNKRSVYYQARIQVNGAALLPSPNILLQFTDRRTSKVLLENVYYYRVK